jgi:hypothetical protein
MCGRLLWASQPRELALRWMFLGYGKGGSEE